MGAFRMWKDTPEKILGAPLKGGSISATIDAAPTLLFHTPELHKYDVKWDVMGWHLPQREVILQKEFKDDPDHRIKYEKVISRIGTTPLKIDEG